jgi:hypothetical protein
MMKLDDARQLGLALFRAGFTPWIAETGDGYIIRILLEGEIINVFRTDVEANKKKLKKKFLTICEFKILSYI